MSWCWVDKRLLLLLHDESLAEHGGATGMRDEGLLDSALAKPLNLLAYGDPDFADLAAAYALGLAKGHASSMPTSVLRSSPSVCFSRSTVFASPPRKQTQRSQCWPWPREKSPSLSIRTGYERTVRRAARRPSMNPSRPIVLEPLHETGEVPDVQRIPRFFHQIQVVVQVVDAREHRAEHFAAAIEMVQVGA
jgi:hypothetical protein